ncbi:hypothetical protein XI09_17445, partial [Bradyrhizobium sp. CCBAU 11386]|uniref:hypothetical protein n=1 Tax=Bradyrhizobium sp. CCBAU 11386 TaxID=1630837 RepID=UPI0023045793
RQAILDGREHGVTLDQEGDHIVLNGCYDCSRGLDSLLRHCERSEAIQNLSAAAVWIASLRSQ